MSCLSPGLNSLNSEEVLKGHGIKGLDPDRSWSYQFKMQNRTPNFLVAESKAERALEHIKILEVRLKMLNARPDSCKSKSITKHVQALEEMLRGYKEYYRLKKTQAEELLNEIHGKEP